MVIFQKLLESIQSGLRNNFSIVPIFLIFMFSITFINFSQKHFLKTVVDRTMHKDMIHSYTSLTTISKFSIQYPQNSTLNFC